MTGLVASLPCALVRFGRRQESSRHLPKTTKHPQLARDTVTLTLLLPSSDVAHSARGGQTGLVDPRCRGILQRRECRYTIARHRYKTYLPATASCPLDTAATLPLPPPHPPPSSPHPAMLTSAACGSTGVCSFTPTPIPTPFFARDQPPRSHRPTINYPSAACCPINGSLRPFTYQECGGQVLEWG